MYAGKQVFGVSAILANLSKQTAYAHLGNKCPNCTHSKENAQHILRCREEGRIRCVNQQIGRLEHWLHSFGTVPALIDTWMDFLWTRGTMKYEGRDTPIPLEYSSLIRSQEEIEWRQTMEGMVSKELLALDRQDILLDT
jgi:hypothetical protein